MAIEMTHEDAVRTGAAEKYILDQLAPEDRQRFEEHYFGCPECAAEVKLGSVFAENARAVFAAELNRPQPRALAAWRWPAFAFSLAGLFAVFNLYLLHQNAGLRAPQAYPAFVLHSVSRGDDQVLEAPRSSTFAGLTLDVPPGAGFAAYRCTLTDAGGENKFTVEVAAPTDPSAPLNILLPIARLAPGRFTLVLSGMRDGTGSELGRYPFLFKLK
ncbi:MAG: zf-HC2 domain-containing protein [Acidobacteriota bacterium]